MYGSCTGAMNENRKLFPVFVNAFLFSKYCATYSLGTWLFCLIAPPKSIKDICFIYNIHTRSYLYHRPLQHFKLKVAKRQFALITVLNLNLMKININTQFPHTRLCKQTTLCPINQNKLLQQKLKSCMKQITHKSNKFSLKF